MALLWLASLLLFVSQFLLDHEIRWWGILCVVAAAINLIDVYQVRRAQKRGGEKQAFPSAERK
ncbi:hypothetical protein ASF54_14315 [Frondihabitans sp. Leaf304]|jgi:hypothetical protein|nr:hypothetical protein ASF54_14315 [Frondihabitans sp. Leaf304]